MTMIDGKAREPKDGHTLTAYLTSKRWRHTNQVSIYSFLAVGIVLQLKVGIETPKRVLSGNHIVRISKIRIDSKALCNMENQDRQ